MSAESIRPKASGLDGLSEWCRRDRTAPRLELAAAAGDPVALAQLLSQLAQPPTTPCDPDSLDPAIEIVAARRVKKLIDLVGQWPDANDPRLDEAGAAAWKAVLRHLQSNDRVDGEAALRGPVAAEARLVIEDARPQLAPVSWTSFCQQAVRRVFALDELRTIDRLGFVETELDVAPLAGRPAVLLRVLRSRWTIAENLADFVESYDVWQATPRDLAVWWEAAAAIDRRDLLADRLGEAIVQRLLAEDEPQRWWPAVLAAFTGWVVP